MGIIIFVAGIIVVIAILVCRCCPDITCKLWESRRKREVEFEQEYPMNPPNSPVAPEIIPTVTVHSHRNLRLSSSRGYVWEDGCQLGLNSALTRTNTSRNIAETVNV